MPGFHVPYLLPIFAPSVVWFSVAFCLYSYVDNVDCGIALFRNICVSPFPLLISLIIFNFYLSLSLIFLLSTGNTHIVPSSYTWLVTIKEEKNTVCTTINKVDFTHRTPPKMFHRLYSILPCVILIKTDHFPHF